MEKNHEMEEDVIDLGELLRLLWNHALQIAAIGLAAALLCLTVCAFALTPRYEASIDLIVNARQDSNASVTSDNINSARNLIDTDAVVIKSSIVLGDQAAATLLQNGDDLFDDRELDVFSPHKPKRFLNHWM